MANEPHGLFDILEVALAPLCGSDPTEQPGRLRDMDAVRGALERADGLRRVAGAIAHHASVMTELVVARRAEREAREAKEAGVVAANAETVTLSRNVDASTRKLVEEALLTQEASSQNKKRPPSQRGDPMPEADPFAGARRLLAADGGLPPTLWGVSKAQFELFIREVCVHDQRMLVWCVQRMYSSQRMPLHTRAQRVRASRAPQSSTHPTGNLHGYRSDRSGTGAGAGTGPPD